MVTLVDSKYIDLFKIIGQTADTLGYECYVIGGYVRDFFLGKENDDLDFVVVGNGIEMAKAVAQVVNAKKFDYYESYGTAKVTYNNIDLEFVGAHPMAGREVYGVENSDKNIFKNANYIIIPSKSSTLMGMNKVKEIGEILEFKNIVTLSKEEHDEMIGFLSQLTHCIAISLMTCKESQNLVEYTGDSFRDLTRIAKINENMWSELFLLNKQELLDQMNLFLQQFNELKNALETEDIDKMKDIMRLSTTRRSYFDR